jgi:hypothetical protein
LGMHCTDAAFGKGIPTERTAEIAGPSVVRLRSNAGISVLTDVLAYRE